MKTLKQLLTGGMYASFRIFLPLFIPFNLFFTPLSAQTVSWDFSGDSRSGSSSVGYISPGTASTGSGTSTSGFPDAGCSNNNPWSIRGWYNSNTVSDAKTNNDYVSFSLSVGAGESFHVTGVSFRSNRSVNAGGTSFGPSNWAVYSNYDNYASALFSGSNPNGTTGTSASCSYHSKSVDIPLNGGESVTFRVYAYNGASTELTTMRIDDFTVTGSSLPIELGAFSAREEGNTVQLSWQTHYEESNAYIIVERSADGQQFREIGRVLGVGNSTRSQDYFYIDEEPLTGLNYYRLRQVDFDGTEHIHHVVSVRIRSKGDQIRFFPTLATSHLTIHYPEAPEQIGKIFILNMLGRTVRQIEVPKGALQQQFNIRDLASGTYVMQYQAGRKVAVLGRFIKQ